MWFAPARKKPHTSVVHHLWQLGKSKYNVGIARGSLELLDLLNHGMPQCMDLLFPRGTYYHLTETISCNCQSIKPLRAQISLTWDLHPHLWDQEPYLSPGLGPNSLLSCVAAALDADGAAALPVSGVSGLAAPCPRYHLQGDFPGWP